MKKYLAIYLGNQEGFDKWNAQDPEARKTQEKAGMDAWKKWMMDNEKAIVDQGAPLGKTKRIDKTGVTDSRNNLAAFTVVQAESYDEAAKLFINHPHFMFFPGESIEIMELLDIPGM